MSDSVSYHDISKACGKPSSAEYGDTKRHSLQTIKSEYIKSETISHYLSIYLYLAVSGHSITKNAQALKTIVLQF